MAFQLAKYVIMTRTGDGMVLLDQRSGRCWQVNESGSVALDVLLGGATADEAAGAVVSRYEVPPERARDDVLALLDSLRGSRLALTS